MLLRDSDAEGSRLRPFRQYGCGIHVNNAPEMLRNLPLLTRAVTDATRRVGAERDGVSRP
ncbi:hypothetical protein GCM10009777_19420 [Microbacterium pumilum]|uniref:Uncharacterized protein n=1 Tax=Microbacterium pumilum TaxID=344165 RepID=A0ABP5DSB6_9MICO